MKFEKERWGIVRNKKEKPHLGGGIKRESVDVDKRP